MNDDVYPIDAGVIRCVCGFDDDDGFTIQCEKCNAWQHGQCVDIYSEQEVPETYYCNRCSDRKVDVESAIQRQLKRKENESKGGGKRKTSKSVKFRTTVENTDSTSNGANTPKTPSTPRIEATPVSDVFENSKPVNGKKKKRLTVQTSQTNTTSREGSDSDTDVELSTGSKIQNNGGNTSSKSGATKGRSTEQILKDAYRAHFVKVEHNIPIGEDVKKALAEIPNLGLNSDLCSFLSVQEFARIQPVPLVVKPVGSTASAGNKFKFGGFSKFGVFTSSDSSTIARGRYVSGLFGEQMLQVDYKKDPINQYRFLGCPKPGVVFVPGANIAIDGRRMGNEGLLFRPNCTSPNLKISTIVVGNKDVFFAAFSCDPVKPGEELTIPWEWDEKHPIQKLFGSAEDVELEAEEKFCLARTYEFVKQRGIECACISATNCILERLKSIKMKELNATSGSSAHPPVSPVTDAGYSTREQRKLQGALSLIDKLSEDTRKRKKSTASPPRAKAKSRTPLGFSDEDEIEEEQKPPTEVHYPPTFKQTLQKQYSEARERFLQNPSPPVADEEELSFIPPRSISPSPVSLNMGHGRRHSSFNFQQPSLTFASETATTDTVKNANNKADSPDIKQPVKAVTPPVAPKLVKKLSFADYMKSKKR